MSAESKTLLKEGSKAFLNNFFKKKTKKCGKALIGKVSCYTFVVY